METKIRKMNEAISEKENQKVVEEAAQIWKRDGIVAFPTETVYGLGANALNPEASEKIYAAKGRPSDNPLILHIAEFSQIEPLVASVSENGKKLMKAFWPGPLTLIFPKSDLVPYETTGGLDTAAIRMPSHTAARKLLRAVDFPIAAPSANISGRPSPTTARHVKEDMDGKIELIIDGGEVGIGVESTIVDVSGEVPVILRPGYITKEMLEEVTGRVEIDPAIVGKGDPNLRPKAPGMKYRHYAPKAPLTIVEGKTEDVIRTINECVKKAAQEKRTVGIIAAEESKMFYPDGIVKVIGSRNDMESVAHNLYQVLRMFDKEKVGVIYSESFPDNEFGQAVMNRLKKAAGQQIIKTQEERELIAIGCDHGGFELKQEIIAYLKENNLEYEDFGTYSAESTDYPIYAKKVAHAVADGKAEKGILICGTGIGISITANKIKGIRAALCSDCFSAEATREHNNANILCMGARVVGVGLALKITETFLNTPFSNEERHIRRINQIEE